jgi:hypothetical protein
MAIRVAPPSSSFSGCSSASGRALLNPGVRCRMKYIVILALLLHPAQSAACSIIFPSPEAAFADSRIVALARPVSISYRPKQASEPSYTGDFRQTILWEVLLSWKGGLKSGDRFTTRQEHSGSSDCTSYFPVRNRSAYLLFGRGRELEDLLVAFVCLAAGGRDRGDARAPR